VRAQVDRDLTTVSWVDRLLGSIKNLGRHNKIGQRGEGRPREKREATAATSTVREVDGGIDSAAAVIEPPKIIPYYRLSLSTWPLRDNKKLLSRFRRVKRGKSLTTGSRYALSPHEGGTRVQHYITQKVHKFNIITNQVFHT
jgi:hypothetical protein